MASACTNAVDELKKITVFHTPPKPGDTLNVHTDSGIIKLTFKDDMFDAEGSLISSISFDKMDNDLILMYPEGNPLKKDSANWTNPHLITLTDWVTFDTKHITKPQQLGMNRQTDETGLPYYGILYNKTKEQYVGISVTGHKAKLASFYASFSRSLQDTGRTFSSCMSLGFLLNIHFEPDSLSKSHILLLSLASSVLIGSYSMKFGHYMTWNDDTNINILRQIDNQFREDAANFSLWALKNIVETKKTQKEKID
ncbi:hypothetical protein DID75_04885 [Candidatus Marinamargulisbacteria bacterium SCGC AG-410-N11]|nr:hypothetical protein DID75_04885 [Candidatus Marinamargulisbacteria bacterium SCGC AG-410-N11]